MQEIIRFLIIYSFGIFHLIEIHVHSFTRHGYTFAMYIECCYVSSFEVFICVAKLAKCKQSTILTSTKYKILTRYTNYQRAREAKECLAIWSIS
jgi:hypothetical protein